MENLHDEKRTGFVYKIENKIILSRILRVGLTPVAGSIFGPLFQTHISKLEFKNEILRSALLDIQLTIFCVCGVDSFLPELEHL